MTDCVVSKPLRMEEVASCYYSIVFLSEYPLMWEVIVVRTWHMSISGAHSHARGCHLMDSPLNSWHVFGKLWGTIARRLDINVFRFIVIFSLINNNGYCWKEINFCQAQCHLSTSNSYEVYKPQRKTSDGGHIIELLRKSKSIWPCRYFWAKILTPMNNLIHLSNQITEISFN